jgi:hypothetical protein
MSQHGGVRIVAGKASLNLALSSSTRTAIFTNVRLMV